MCSQYSTNILGINLLRWGVRACVLAMCMRLDSAIRSVRSRFLFNFDRIYYRFRDLPTRDDTSPTSAAPRARLRFRVAARRAASCALTGRTHAEAAAPLRSRPLSFVSAPLLVAPFHSRWTPNQCSTIIDHLSIDVSESLSPSLSFSSYCVV